MEPTAQLAALRAEADLLAAVRPLDADVATCPGWTVGDVLRHTGRVHRFAVLQVRADDPAGLVRGEIDDGPGDDDPDALARWVRDGAAALVDAVAADPDRTCPTFGGPAPASWWARRALHETTVHRWDAEAAVGRAGPIDPARAVDGIDEALTELVPRRLDRSAFDADATVHLHATDVEGEWIVDVGPERYGVRHGHEKGDVAARAPAADLLLLVWGRLPAARLEVFGDASLLDRWHDAAAL